MRNSAKKNFARKLAQQIAKKNAIAWKPYGIQKIFSGE